MSSVAGEEPTATVDAGAIGASAPEPTQDSQTVATPTVQEPTKDTTFNVDAPVFVPKEQCRAPPPPQPQPAMGPAAMPFLLPNGQRPPHMYPDAGSRRPPVFAPQPPMSSVLATVPPATACACAAGPFPPQGNPCAVGGAAPPMGVPAMGANHPEALKDIWAAGTPAPDSPPLLTTSVRADPPPLPPHFLDQSAVPPARPAMLQADSRFAALRGSFLQHRAAMGYVPPPPEIARSYRLISPDHPTSQQGSTGPSSSRPRTDATSGSGGDNGAGKVLLQLAKGQVSKEPAGGANQGVSQGEELLNMLRGGGSNSAGQSEGKQQGAELLNMIKAKGGPPPQREPQSKQWNPEAATAPRAPPANGWGRSWPKQHGRAEMWGSKGSGVAVHAK
mmetsp:Transcript_49136/g.117041  ORF Transcript_49136/g.117041 Transcript_49136/m.117041 type:complete len:389 (+) Transcript_49136:124-1290(+)